MNAAKIQLSAAEMLLVTDPAWILTKNSIMGKVVALMAGLSEEYLTIWENGFPSGGETIWENGFPSGGETIWESGFTAGYRGNAAGFPAGGNGPHPPTPKIAKGENYRGLPYVMLDYPRVFGREDVLAIRTMFWWGHEFSLTLHLKGHYKTLFLPVISGHWDRLAAAGFRVGISEEEWRHEHVEENYGPMQGVLPDERLPFFKLSARIGLDQWDAAPDLLGELFRTLVDVIGVRI